jgi:hypothetical protein
MATEKDPAAVSLGRRGGFARKQSLTPEELSKQGRNAVAARWDKATPGKRADVGRKLAEARAKKRAAAAKTTASSKRGTAPPAAVSQKAKKKTAKAGKK